MWKQGLGFELTLELMDLPSRVGLPAAEIGVRTAAAVDEEMYERAQRLSEEGAALARDAGLDAGLD